MQKLRKNKENRKRKEEKREKIEKARGNNPAQLQIMPAAQEARPNWYSLFSLPLTDVRVPPTRATSSSSSPVRISRGRPSPCRLLLPLIPIYFLLF
jgi:hypothetical protein